MQFDYPQYVLIDSRRPKSNRFKCDIKILEFQLYYSISSELFLLCFMSFYG